MKAVMNTLFLVSLLVMLSIGCGNATLNMEESEPMAVERFGEVIVPSAVEPIEENQASAVIEPMAIRPPEAVPAEETVTQPDYITAETEIPNGVEIETEAVDTESAGEDEKLPPRMGRQQ